MSYIVKQEIKGNIYLYEVSAKWDKEKKQSRQTRKYIGPLNPKKKKINTQNSKIIYKKLGNNFLLQDISEKLGIRKILKKHFPESYNEICALAFFHICTGDPLYLFHHWLDEQVDLNCKSLHSTEVSSLCESIGTSQTNMRDFFTDWISNYTSSKEVYYDVTSISSYSTNIDFIEWGYNRDKEKLPQLNIGLACNEDGLPLFYQVYPGSISDVSTLKNTLMQFSYYNLQNVRVILDRGFCSKFNIGELNKLKDEFTFIQPMTFSMKKVLQLLKSSRKELKKSQTAFKYLGEVLHYTKKNLNIEGVHYDAHLYYNEKAEIDIKHNLLARLLELKNKMDHIKFDTMKKYLEYRADNISEKDLPFFKLDKKSKHIELNYRNIQSCLIKSGYYILLSNAETLDRDGILSRYRNRDVVEKLFDVEKNELDGGRLRAHSQYNNDGRIFIKFIALIIHSKLSSISRESKILSNYSIKEMMAELAKIRQTMMGENMMITEISKQQRKIFSEFGISEEDIKKPSY